MKILKRPGPDAGCRANEEGAMSKKAVCKFMFCIMEYIFSTVVVYSFNAYRVWRCCVMEVEQPNSKTTHKNRMSVFAVNSVADKSLTNLPCLEL